MTGESKTWFGHIKSTWIRILQEIGLLSVYRASLDTQLLIIARVLRFIGYGATTLILVAYLKSLGISDTRIGLFMSLTLVGDVIISLTLTLITDSVGRRFMLGLGAVLMALSGIGFGVFTDYWILLVTAIFGVISPLGAEIGPFRAIEESTLSHLSSAEVRGDIFAWYHLASTGGTAIGMIIGGWVVDSLIGLKGWSQISAYRLIFFGYGSMGFLKLILTFVLSKNCELATNTSEEPASEATALLQNQQPSEAEPKKGKGVSVPSFSSESRRLFLILSVLFGMDALASGLAPISWIASFVQRKFSMDEGALGSIFFSTSIMSSISIPASAALARRYGNVKIMVFTHLPSAVALTFLGMPNQVAFVIALMIIHASTRYMETTPRSAFLASVMLPRERTAMMGALMVVRTGCMSLGPLITGVLVEHKLFWVAFFLAGILKLTYDFVLLVVFVNYERKDENETGSSGPVVEEERV